MKGPAQLRPCQYLAVEGSSLVAVRSTNSPHCRRHSRPLPSPSRRTSCRTKARRPLVAALPVSGRCRRWLAASLEKRRSPTWLERRSSSFDLARMGRRRGRMRRMKGRWRTVLQCRSQVSCPPSAQRVKFKGTVSRVVFCFWFSKKFETGPLWYTQGRGGNWFMKKNQKSKI